MLLRDVQKGHRYNKNRFGRANMAVVCVTLTYVLVQIAGTYGTSQLLIEIDVPLIVSAELEEHS
jgi:hypothetical protein